jgi:hypothetical protein
VEDNSPAKAGLVRSNPLGLYKREQKKYRTATQKSTQKQSKEEKINPKTETKNRENHRKETEHK